ncbi:MAG: 1-acyl-sn-glycerol-3-phosphate acyltransferase [Clostridiales bacterium]|nr:1-acyl-sn-glycerol-3-phosphate acyltransferase [Clostridiales bacterium]MBE5746680.1 1-acyl-sn-glycerol-3-phosphate acyltransferase [Clostridiales bacterium]
MEEKKDNEMQATPQEAKTKRNEDKTAAKKKKKDKPITTKANKKGRHISKFLNFLRVMLLPLAHILRPFRYYGNKKVKDGAYVYVCNHYSIFDLVYPGATTWEIIHFIAKKENFETPILGSVARKVKAICANRDGSDVRTMLDSMKCLKNGEKICIFPEGTRNKTNEAMLPFHHGAAVMSIKTKTPIIPMVIYKKPRWFRVAHILIGEPIEFSEYYGKKMTEEEIASVDDRLREHMLNMRKEHAEFLANKKAGKKKAK